jgi:hypothetical protein
MPSSYYDTLYGRDQRIVLWGVVVDNDVVTAECGALGDYLPKTMPLFAKHDNQSTPVTTIDLKGFVGVADDGEGLNTDLTFTVIPTT